MKTAAEAQAIFIRVRNIRQQVYQLSLQRVLDVPNVTNALSTFEIATVALLDCEPQLLVLDGYERKARSRRKKAFRALYG